MLYIGNEGRRFSAFVATGRVAKIHKMSDTSQWSFVGTLAGSPQIAVPEFPLKERYH